MSVITARLSFSARSFLEAIREEFVNDRVDSGGVQSTSPTIPMKVKSLKYGVRQFMPILRLFSMLDMQFQSCYVSQSSLDILHNPLYIIYVQS